MRDAAADFPEECQSAMQAAADQLREAFQADAVLILLTFQNSAGSTITGSQGCGNYHARKSMCRDFVLRDDEAVREWERKQG